MQESQNTQTADNAETAANSQNELQHSASANADRNTDNSEASDNHDADSGSEEGQGKEEQGQQDAGQKNRPNRLQKRFNHLTKRASDAEALAEYWRQKAEGQGHQESKKIESTKQASDAEPSPDDFDTNAEYIRAYTKWELKQEKVESERQAAEAKTRETKQKVANEYNSRLAEFKKATPDFDSAVESFAEEFGDFKAAPEVMEALMDSEFGPEIVYKILKSPEEYERLSNMSASAVIRELGRMEAGIAAGKSSPITPIKTSKAPAPISPIGKGSTPVTKSLSDPNISFADYEKIRNQQLKNKS